MVGVRRQFSEDTRAIEGLPIRLVIALVVGVATMSVMLDMVSSVGTIAVAELDIESTPDVIEPGSQTLGLRAIGPNGEGVEDATVIVRAGTAQMDGVVTGDTGANGRLQLQIDAHTRVNQQVGTLIIEIKPPAGSQYIDRRSNTEILVVQS
ncbi:MAG: hypothetical protein J07HQX50_02690 [Haloquadratum sp. J07HQX50]|jgi:hypothetical protein|nr:MAG: hypothetical protein J07HQX50_02690 [Haloquadratum sp. J07HQX50]